MSGGENFLVPARYCLPILRQTDSKYEDARLQRSRPKRLAKTTSSCLEYTDLYGSLRSVVARNC